MPSNLTSTSSTASWGGAAINGKIHLCPYSANHILIYDPIAETMTGSDQISADVDGGDKQWLGGVALNGKLYCIPTNAKHVLVYDTATGKVSDGATSPMVPSTLITGASQWSRGVELNGKVSVRVCVRVCVCARTCVRFVVCVCVCVCVRECGYLGNSICFALLLLLLKTHQNQHNCTIQTPSQNNYVSPIKTNNTHSKVYGIPLHADYVLVVDGTTHAVTGSEKIPDNIRSVAN